MTLGDVSRNRVALFGMQLDVVRLGDAVERILGWTLEQGAPLRYVVTPNVQHTMIYQEHEEFRRAYQDASLVLTDGTPLVWAARLFGSPLPERVAGSDLLPALFAAVPERRTLSVFLLGAAPGVGERATRAIEATYPNVRVVGTESPPFGFEKDERENERLLHAVSRYEPDVLVVGLGAPKQELWTYRFRNELRARVAVCAGASIDFLAGEKSRAPRWMRGTGLEWMHRVATEPRRLARRYASDGLRLPGLLLREWRSRRG
jgi:N-acetylglucosaminyldiphosphoundecaprenol N-acetyl-beta-D-mannosaminyltransferase